MGGQQSRIFSEEDYQYYDSCTYLTRMEIDLCYRKWQSISGTRDNALYAAHLQQLPEFRVNPFISRLVDVFGDPETHTIPFDGFVDMLSVLSLRADPSVKMEALFRLFDVDNDRYISHSDLVEYVRLLVGGEMSEEEIDYIARKTIYEADLDSSESLSWTEWVKVANRIPDLFSRFQVTLLR